MRREGNNLIFDTEEEQKIIDIFCDLLRVSNRQINNHPTKPGDVAIYSMNFAETIDNNGNNLISAYINITIENQSSESKKIPPNIH